MIPITDIEPFSPHIEFCALACKTEVLHSGGMKVAIMNSLHVLACFVFMMCCKAISDSCVSPEDEVNLLQTHMQMRTSLNSAAGTSVSNFGKAVDGESSPCKENATFRSAAFGFEAGKPCTEANRKSGRQEPCTDGTNKIRRADDGNHDRTSTHEDLGNSHPSGGVGSVVFLALDTDSGGFTLSNFLTEVFLGIFIVLSVCSDDVVWLLPFMTKRISSCLTYAILYIIVMVLFPLSAWCLVYGVQGAKKWFKSSQTQFELWVQIASLVLLAGITVKLWWEHDSEEESEKDEPVSEQIPSSDNNKKQPLDDSTPSEDSFAMKSMSSSEDSISNFIGICFAGNLDNLSVYIPLLMSRTLSPICLMISVLIASLIVLLIVMGVAQLKFVVNLIQKVPIYVIMTCVTIGTGCVVLWNLLNPE